MARSSSKSFVPRRHNDMAALHLYQTAFIRWPRDKHCFPPSTTTEPGEYYTVASGCLEVLNCYSASRVLRAQPALPRREAGKSAAKTAFVLSVACHSLFLLSPSSVQFA